MLHPREARIVVTHFLHLVWTVAFLALFPCYFYYGFPLQLTFSKFFWTFSPSGSFWIPVKQLFNYWSIWLPKYDQIQPVFLFYILYYLDHVYLDLISLYLIRFLDILVQGSFANIWFLRKGHNHVLYIIVTLHVLHTWFPREPKRSIRLLKLTCRWQH